MAALPQDPRQNPPWSGPAFAPVVANTRQPLEQPASFPFEGVAHNIYPPVCLRSHWDAEQIIRRTLPNSKPISTPLTPRPWTKICMTYMTTADFEDAPRPDDSVVFPSGGDVYPPTRYREAIDKESLLRRLDRPLDKWCDRGQYVPPTGGDMYVPNATVEKRGGRDSSFIEELAFPKACMRGGEYECRFNAEKDAWARSPRLFNNTTKQDRYAVSRPDLAYPHSTMTPRPDRGAGNV